MIPELQNTLLGRKRRANEGEGIMNNTFTNRPVTMNENKNLLEIEEHMYILDDVKKPNVFRNMFPYSEIPKIPFNDRTVPHDMPKDIWITDTTFRDGQQSRAPYSTEQIVTIYDYLHRLGGENGLIRASEFFLYSKKDRDAVYKCLEKGYKFPEITSWIRASKEDFKLVKEIGMKETGILVSCSDYHIFMKLKMTRKQAMEHYLSVIKECLEEGISPRCHLEDITRADIYGYVVPFCLELMKLMKEYQIPIKIRACDTMGYGVNYPGAVIPRSVQGIIYALHTHAGVPHELLEWHGHNDFYKAVVQSFFFSVNKRRPGFVKTQIIRDIGFNIQSRNIFYFCINVRCIRIFLIKQDSGIPRAITSAPELRGECMNGKDTGFNSLFD